ncbi:MAG: flagellar motor protein MotB [Myxococcales bacterium]|nr:flagellar motor protein MotB [Myxococcales bacterium]
MSRQMLSLLLALCGGCAASAAHQARLAEVQHMRRQAIAREQALLVRIGTLEKQLDELTRRLREEEQGRARVAKQLDDTTALLGELRHRLAQLGQDPVEIEGALGESLREAQERLAELRRQRLYQEAAARAFRLLEENLRPLIDGGQVQMMVREGRMLLVLAEADLFEPRRAQPRPEARPLLARVAQALRGVPDRRFLIAAHTDDLPADASRFASNWDLSASRAVEVTRLLIEYGVRPQALVAAAYAEFDPLYPNDTPEHRARNRRVEIVIQADPVDGPQLAASR